jgi:hypothetical protein
MTGLEPNEFDSECLVPTKRQAKEEVFRPLSLAPVYQVTKSVTGTLLALI